MDNKEFLKQQYELLIEKKSDPSIEWQDITDFRTEALGIAEHRDSIRKGAKLFYEYLDAGWINDPDEIKSISKLDNNYIEMRKERQKLSDQRVEYNRLLRQQARRESLLDLIKDVITENVETVELLPKVNKKAKLGNNDLLISCTDLHTGVEVDLWHNRFNCNILADRMSKYVEKIIEIQQRHNSDNAYIVIGELVSGIIHDNLRLQNNMDLIEQFKYACELITAMLIRLSEYFENIYVYTTPGNHSRIIAKKENSLDGENIDLLAPFYLQAKFGGSQNIHIMENLVDPSIAVFDILGNKVVSVHGDKDNPETVVQNMTLMLRQNIDIVLLGHRHTNGLKTVNDTKIISAGCFVGGDTYASNMRKRNRPEQAVAVITEDGVDCIYDVKID